MTWVEEWALIKAAAYKVGLDPYFIAAIRKCENGGPGREFGVLAISAPTYADQLRVACATVKHRLVQYGQSEPVLFTYLAPDGEGVVIYSPNFIDWFASIWAPGGAGNDPKDLNRNWANNCKYEYVHLLDADHQKVSSLVHGLQ